MSPDTSGGLWLRPSLKFPLAIRAAGFDLDGTLVETLPDLHEAALRMLAQIGRPAVDAATVRAFIGEGVDRLVQQLLQVSGEAEPDAMLFKEAAEKFRAHYAEVLTRASHPFPGVLSALVALRARGCKLACITNKPARFTGPLLDALGLARCLDLVVSGDSLARKKPDALPLLHAARQFGVEPAQLLMVGDSAVDTGAARAAGCPVFCVPYGYRGPMELQQLDCDAIVPTLVEMLELVNIAHA